MGGAYNHRLVGTHTEGLECNSESRNTAACDNEGLKRLWSTQEAIRRGKFQSKTQL